MTGSAGVAVRVSSHLCDLAMLASCCSSLALLANLLCVMTRRSDAHPGVFPAFKPAQVHGAVVGLEGASCLPRAHLDALFCAWPACRGLPPRHLQLRGKPRSTMSLMGTFMHEARAALLQVNEGGSRIAHVAGVGVVKANGEGASRFRVDQRVVAAPWPSSVGNGTWQQYVVVAEGVRASL